MSDGVLIAAVGLMFGVITLVINGVLDRRTKNAAADLVVAQAQALKEETATVVRQTYQAMVEDLQERLTVVEAEQAGAIAEHAKTVARLLDEIADLKERVIELQAKIDALTKELVLEKEKTQDAGA